MGFKILAINPGSTSTKIALYDDEQPTLALTLRHSAEEIARFPRIIDQLDWRKEMVLEALAKNNFDVKSLSAVIGRGGLIKPIESGVYVYKRQVIAHRLRRVIPYSPPDR